MTTGYINIAFKKKMATASYSGHLRFISWQKTGYHDRL